MAKQVKEVAEQVLTDPSMTTNERMEAIRAANVRLMEAVTNVQFSRARMAKAMSDPRRSINDECGYPDTDEITPEFYRDLYERESIAARVVEVWPDECWKVQPTIYETEDTEEETPFEVAWKEVSKSLMGDSHYEGEEGDPVWEYLHRVDIRSGIGQFGLLLLGIDDGKELHEPVDGINEMGFAAGKPPQRNLLYLRVFDESQITAWEKDPANPRYGKPTEYVVTMGIVGDTSGQGTAPTKVHWHRVIHVADNLGSSEVFGVPRMRPVYNRLVDLRKLYGSSAEMYWLGAFFGLSFETHPGLALEDLPDLDEATTRTQVEKFMNSLQRYIAIPGLHANSLAPQVVDPTPQIEIQIEGICIQVKIPKRIFTGSERGELASSQDERAWGGRVHYRQVGYLTPRLVVPFVDRLILFGVLPVPEQYFVGWPEMTTLAPLERADVVVKRAEALTKYVQGGVVSLIAPMDYLTREMDYTQEEAEEILNNAVDYVDETDRGAMAGTEEEEEEQGGGGAKTEPKTGEGGE